MNKSINKRCDPTDRKLNVPEKIVVLIRAACADHDGLKHFRQIVTVRSMILQNFFYPGLMYGFLEFIGSNRSMPAAS